MLSGASGDRRQLVTRSDKLNTRTINKAKKLDMVIAVIMVVKKGL